MKTFNSSFVDVEEMDMETLAELISVYDKIGSDPKEKNAFIDDIL